MKNLTFLILARSGSKRIKNKNLKKIGRSDLLKIKILQCKSLRLGKVVVSTNSLNIAKKSLSYGADKIRFRPKKYASNKSSTISVVLDFLRDEIKKGRILTNYIAICHPTNPFLKNKSFSDAYKKITKIKDRKIDSIISYTKSPVHPFLFVENKKKIKFNLFNIKGKKYSSVERSQDRPKSYVLSASIKISKTKYFLKYLKKTNNTLNIKPFNIKHCLGQEISKKESFDINTKYDLTFANYFNK